MKNAKPTRTPKTGATPRSHILLAALLCLGAGGIAASADPAPAKWHPGHYVKSVGVGMGGPDVYPRPHNYLFWSASPRPCFENVKALLATPELARDPAGGLDARLPTHAFPGTNAPGGTGWPPRKSVGQP